MGETDETIPRAVVRRGRVYDLNRAAAEAGVLLDSPLRQARQVCPALLATDYDAAVYEAAWAPFLTALRRETHLFEPDGPSGLFVDFAGSGEPESVLRRTLGACGGFELVAGLAESKFLARAAVMACLAPLTHHERPMYLPLPSPEVRLSGQPPLPVLTLIDLTTGVAGAPSRAPSGASAGIRAGTGQGRVAAFLAMLPVGYLWPVVEETRERLYRLGLRTCGDLGRVSREELVRLFGAHGHRLADLSSGLDRDEVRAAYTQDEVVRRVDFNGPLNDRLALKRSLAALGEDLGRSLLEEGLGCRTLRLTLALEDGATATRQRVFSNVCGDPGRISGALSVMLEGLRCQAPVLGIELSASGLEEGVRQQLTFLPKAVGQAQQASLLRSVSFLERKFPGGVVRVGLPEATRRERVLALVDPVRRRERSVRAD